MDYKFNHCHHSQSVGWEVQVINLKIVINIIWAAHVINEENITLTACVTPLKALCAVTHAARQFNWLFNSLYNF